MTAAFTGSFFSSFVKKSAALTILLGGLAAGISASAQAPGAGAAASSAAPGVSGIGNGSATVGNSNNGSNGTDGQTSQGRNSRGDRDTDNDRRTDIPAGSQDLLTEFQQMVATTTGHQLAVFGASIFGQEPTTFAPIEDVPVNSSFVIAPGDQLRIQLSGQVNQTLSLTVDRNGAIALPGLGPVHVAGVPFGQLSSYLHEQASKIYRNFDVNVSLGALHTIQVFVVGQARFPGSYTISSLSTLLNALFASGGPLPSGTLRDIQVKRGDQTITHFDLYDLLLHGDKSRDISLTSGDVIFIPFVGPQIAVVGSVNHPSIFELRGESDVADVLKMAGGDTPVAAGQSLRLERVFEHRDRSIRDIDPVADSTLPLRDGDILSVTSIVDRFRDAITLRGNVANPGRYVWRPGMRVSDLIPNKEALVTRNYWRKRNQLGQLVTDYDTSTSQSNNEGALRARGGSGISGAPGSQAGDPNKRAAATSDSGGASVGVALLGNTDLFAAKTDVILSAPDIDWSYAVIERQSTSDLTTSLIPFDLGKVIQEHDPSQNPELLPGDVVTIFSKADLRVPSSQQTRFVKLEGEFVHVGVYSVQPGETLRGLLRRAGGFTPEAYLYASEFTRESTRRVEQQRLHEYADQLEAQISASTASLEARAVTPADQSAASATSADARSAVARLRQIDPVGRIVLDLTPASAGIAAVPDLALEDGDRFIVPRVPASVNVEGQVYSANAFVYEQNRRVIDYLRIAGGPDREADRKRTFVLRADGSVVSRQYGDVDRAPIFPGDTVVVPPVLDKRAVLQRVVDLATIIGQLGFAAAAVDVLR